MSEGLAAVGGLVQGLAREGGFQGDVGDPPEARDVERVDLRLGHLGDGQNAVAGVEARVGRGGSQVVGAERGRASGIASVEDELLPVPGNGGGLSEDLAGSLVADDDVLLASQDDQERLLGDVGQFRLARREDLAGEDRDDGLGRREVGLGGHCGHLDREVAACGMTDQGKPRTVGPDVRGGG